MSVSEKLDGRGAGRSPVRWSALFGHLVRVKFDSRFHVDLIYLNSSTRLPAVWLDRTLCNNPAIPGLFSVSVIALRADETDPSLPGIGAKRLGCRFRTSKLTCRPRLRRSVHER